jgi:glycerol-3-phosphate dehydrogenase (NAD(P)+)
MSISVIGSGAFGTALAVALAGRHPKITLWARDASHVAEMQKDRENTRRLPRIPLPDTLHVTSDITAALASDTLLLALPAQTLGAFLTTHAPGLAGKTLVACCKGIDIATMSGPSSLIAQHCPSATAAVLTGPSFAHDIAKGLPTALTLACQDEKQALTLQDSLSTDTIRLYRTNDVIGAELGGALKNVIAIACGVAIGARLGESARAALMTRGFAEMQRMAQVLGADPETLSGLSGFGDLALTCTSEGSRNYRYGLALGEQHPFDPSITVEGAATAKAINKLAQTHDLDMPICAVVAGLSRGTTALPPAMQSLLARPLKQEVPRT